MSQMARERYKDPEYKKRWLKSRINVITPAYRKNLSDAMKKVWAARKELQSLALSDSVNKSAMP